ncbi:Zinc finger protein [Halotydeus destructor]|nr:Zinc finger protein [Halotydeus destructor]
MSGMKYTCISCRVSFADAELQRDHYKSEWHRYNLKRKVAQLSPVTRDDYEKIEAQHLKKADELGEIGAQFKCECCRKSFGHEKAWLQHNQSKKHVDASKLFTPKPILEATAVGEEVNSNEIVADKKAESSEGSFEILDSVGDDADNDWESVSGDEGDIEYGEALEVTECLFCPRSGKSLEENLQHMTIDHSFFLPDAEYLHDLEGLIKYLGEKVGAGYRCLWCCETGRGFRSVNAVQRHMADKGHCKMRLEPGDTLLEYSDFYDYSPSHPEGSNKDDADEEVDIDELRVDENMQLILPSGATAGHRSLAVYYKQNLKTRLPQRQDGKRHMIHDLLSQYRALGWKESNKVAVHQKAQDLRYLSKRYLKLGISNNKVGQMHLRNQTFLFK